MLERVVMTPTLDEKVEPGDRKSQNKPSEASEDPQLIRDAIKECVLLNFGYRFTCGEIPEDVRFELITTEAKWRSQFIAHQEARLVRLFVYLTDDQYPQALQRRAGELVHRLNETIILGHYAYECKGGGVSFHLAEDFRNRECTADDIEKMMNAVAFPLRLWRHSFEKIQKPKVVPVDALQAALIEAGASEEDASVSKATRRAILQLI